MARCRCSPWRMVQFIHEGCLSVYTVAQHHAQKKHNNSPRLTQLSSHVAFPQSPEPDTESGMDASCSQNFHTCWNCQCGRTCLSIQPLVKYTMYMGWCAFSKRAFSKVTKRYILDAIISNTDQVSLILRSQTILSWTNFSSITATAIRNNKVASHTTISIKYLYQYKHPHLWCFPFEHCISTITQLNAHLR